jgi:glycosyltransferase involved in cell wall biosynthesis
MERLDVSGMVGESMTNQVPKPILFVTTTLGTGGAERMLLKVLQRLDRNRFEPVVVSLLDEGTTGRQIADLGIRVVCLRMDRLSRIAAAPFVLARLIRQNGFALIQGWMYHGNLLAWVGRMLARSKAPLSFGIRQSLYGLARERFNTRWVIRANAWLSRWTQGCMFNSRFSLETHREFGFRGKNLQVIPNGFDLEAFAPRPAEGAALRAELAPSARFVVGMVARFHPVKGHHDFLKAAVVVRQSLPGVMFFLAGTGVNHRNAELVQWMEELGLSDSVVLLGERKDVAELNSAFDIACLASLAEAFPNVVGESMACGVPCVVTNVGDCAEIVGETGRIAYPGAPDSLAAAMLNLLEMNEYERASLGMAARERVVERFDMTHIVRLYEEYFAALMSIGQSMKERDSESK